MGAAGVLRSEMRLVQVTALIQHFYPNWDLQGVSGCVGQEMAPQVGLEPTTLRLTAGCSAIELLRSVVLRVYSK